MTGTVGRSIIARRNGLALAADFMDAATLLGVVGLVSLRGFHGPSEGRANVRSRTEPLRAPWGKS